MNHINTLALSPLALLSLFASAATPSFDCSKTSNDVEVLICKDQGLANLDKEMATLYPKAIANLSPEDRNSAKAQQRGWVKGRNECWKTQDMRNCIEYSYRLRISDLQINAGQLSVPNPVFYQCGKAVSLETYIYKNAKIPVAVVNLNEGDDAPVQVRTYLQPDDSKQQRYEGENLTLVTMGNTAILQRFEHPDLTCQQARGNIE
ncbi:DUF1311 domain-containing protein [Aeromonas jandaei]|nr:lysozyme inhibitor LprI family protein [Aeromonas jandaei]MBL0625352.1 DUF1311 domain-containing protein [Aeromonas jandaei]